MFLTQLTLVPCCLVVTTRDPRDMDYLRQCLSTDIEPIQKAGLLPTSTHIETFSDALEKLGLRHGSKNLHLMLRQFNDVASVKSDYFVCRQDPMVKIAKEISPLDLEIVSSDRFDCFVAKFLFLQSFCFQPDKYILCQCPVSEKGSTSMDVVKRFAAKKAVGQSSGLTKNMIPKAPKSFDDLARLCGIYSELELFMWLQRKFPPGNVMEQQAAQVLRDRAVQFISEGLRNVSEGIFCVILQLLRHILTSIQLTKMVYVSTPRRIS
jgi:Mitochondrial degradasome RNA helicase subunit C terminal